MKHNRKYKLLKDLPDGAIVGDIYVDNGYGKYTNQRMDASKSPVIEHNSYFSWQVETSPDFFEEVNTVEKPEFIIGVDPFRGNIEWVDDTKKAVVFKKDKDGDFIIAYHSRPFSQEQFEKDMKQAQDYFKKAPLFCEECREFGNHKNNCSKRNPEPSSKKEEGWEILSVIGKSTGFIYKKRQGEFFYKEGYLDIKLSQVLDGNVVSGCEIHSVLRKSDNTVFTVGDEVGYKINDTKFIVKTIKISGEPYLLDGDTFHKHLLPLRNATKAPTNTVEDKPLFSMKDIESCYEVAGKLYSPLYCDFYNALKELARSKTNNQ
jgi:hypothetical protein